MESRFRKCSFLTGATLAALTVLATGCGSGGGGSTSTDSGSGGTAEPAADSEVSLGDGTTGGTTPPADAAVPDVGQPPTPDVGQAVDSTVVTDGPVAPDSNTLPDASQTLTCDSHEVIDLNAALAASGDYTGTTAGASVGTVGTCGGGAGGELVFKYTVHRALDRITFRTDHPETTSPTVLYVRSGCDANELACNRGNPDAPGTRAVVENPPIGDLFVFVDQGARDGGGAFSLTVEENGAAACRDLEDNDVDGLIDLADPGCTGGDDDDELDPQTPPACLDGVDNDGNGLTDYPADPECDAAGDTREGPLCALPIPSTDVGMDGGIFPTDLSVPGPDSAAGSCWFEQAPEHVFILTLDRESNVTVINNSLQQRQSFVTLYARTNCDQAPSEIGCSDPGRGQLQLNHLAAGTYFVFAEYSVNFGGQPPQPGALTDIQFNITPTQKACANGIDDDRDDLIDLLDPGCTDARDNDETDPAVIPFCANGIDDDGDGTIDFPADDGCSAAGDDCETAGFGLCGGACIDLQADAQNCGACGRTCDAGVECIEGFCGGLFTFEGYVTNLPEANLGGWEQCFVDGYGSNTPIGDLRENCVGDYLLVGCRPAGSDGLQLAAMGETDEVLLDTGNDPNGTHEHNGVSWYFSENSSMGFVPLGAVAARNSCDTNALPDFGSPDDGTAEGRLCWHTSGAIYNPGFRCGATVAYDNSLERVVYTSHAAAPPQLCGDAVDNNGNGLVDAADPGCRSPWSAVEGPAPAAAPACDDGADNDGDGLVDFPNDPDCLAAGDESEAPRCAAAADVIEVGQRGGSYNIAGVAGDDGIAGSCGDGSMRAQIFALTLDDPSEVTIAVTNDAGSNIAAPVYIRTACDDAASEIACHAANPVGPMVVHYIDRGLVYVVVEQGRHRSPWTVNIAVASQIRQCNDEIDNDGDGNIDAADAGCTQGMDNNEADDAMGPVECNDGADNDGDGLVDWPADSDCQAAGDLSEHLVCIPPYDLQALPAGGGVIPVVYAAGPGAYNGTCGDGPSMERVFTLHLDDPSSVRLGQYGGPIIGNPLYGTVYIRGLCDDSATELGCDGDQFRGQGLNLARLEPGDYFVFAEDSFNWQPGDPNIQPELHVEIHSLLKACENHRDDDGDGLIDVADLGCTSGLDDDETDPVDQQFLCSNMIDDDADGNIDYPGDDGCVAAGDPCEEGANYIQCNGACLDGAVDPNNCGHCGNVCADGVDCIDGFCGGLYYVPGVQQNVDEATLGGWHVCNHEGYSDMTDVGQMQAACGGQYVALGCRPMGSQTYTLLAMGERAQVFNNVGDQNNNVTESNGVNFYFSGGWSMGFVPLGTAPERNSCDTGQDQGDLRMCWHTSNNSTQPGYRCGQNYPFDNAWERVVLTTN